MSTNSTSRISNDDIEKTKKYTEALNELKKAVIGVNSKLPEFSGGLKEGLKALGEKLPEVVDSIQKLNAQNKELASSGQKPKNILKELASSFLSWNSLISVGMTLLVKYSDVIADWVVSLFKGADAVDELKMQQGALNDAFKNTAYRKAVADIVELSAKIKLAKDNYANKNEVLKEYNEILGDTLGKTNDLNVAEKNITDLGNNYIQMMYYKAAATAALNSSTDETIEAQKDILQATEKSAEAEKALEAFKKKEAYNNEMYGAASTARAKIFLVQQQKNADAELTIAQNKANKLSAATANLYEDLNKQAQKFAAHLPPPPKPPETPTLVGKAVWEKQLTEQQEMLNKLDANSKSYVTESEPTIKKTKKIRAILAGYDVKTDEPKATDHGSERPDNTADALKELTESKERQAELLLNAYAKQIEATNKHFEDLKKIYKKHKDTVIQLEKERIATLADINQKFQSEDLKKLDTYQEQLNKAAREHGKTAQELGLQQLQDEHTAQITEITKTGDEAAAQKSAIQKRIIDLNKQGRKQEANSLNQALQYEQTIIDKANSVKLATDAKFIEDEKTIKQGIEKDKVQKGFEEKRNDLQEGVDSAHEDENWKKEFNQKQQLLDLEKQQAIAAAEGKEKAIEKVTNDYNKKQQQLDKARLDAQAENQKKYLKTVDSLSNSLTSIFGKNNAASKVAFKAHQAAAAAQVIIDTKKAIMGIWSADGAIPFIGVPKAIAETAIVAAVGASSLASIIKQKPGFAAGGQYISDGRGALLPGYSRNDNTNAYLRSGEAVVVSEAMRNPWARNLVSAINVAHGGRDFSIPNPGRGYAIGGIFTDGGSANRYYSQPMNDVKDLANTLAYQMINNFPPVYVDVKDINNQQNILAQTINRVNL